MPPDVSVVIPCYNQGRFLRDAVDSVLGQRSVKGGGVPRVEVIVVNDGSTDETKRVAAEYGDRITYIELANGGVCVARNAGVRAATGEFLHFLDADDWIAPDFFALLLDAAAKNPDSSIVFGSCQVTDEDKRPLWTLTAKPFPEGDPLHTWLKGCYYSVHTPLVRRQLFTAGTLWDATFKSTEDWDLWIRIAAAGATYLAVPEAVCMYRRYGGSKSTKFEQIYRNGTRMLRSHARHHGNCGLCRRALKTGLKNFRNYCLGHSYWYCFGELRRRQGLPAAAGYIARTCARDPRLVVEVIHHAFERWLPRKPVQPFAGSAEHAARAHS